MINSYKNNIKDTLRWNDDQFDLFLHYWNMTFNINNTNPIIYNSSYFEYLLSLFFVLKQIDLGLKNIIVDSESVLLALLTFYIADDKYPKTISEHSLDVIHSFLENIKDLCLINQNTLLKTYHLLNYFNSSSYVSDLVNLKDLAVIKDLLLVTDPVVLNPKASMFYYDDPYKITFRVAKPYPTPNQFFDASFNVAVKINNNLLKQLYFEKLHRLMEIQSKKSIFPF